MCLSSDERSVFAAGVEPVVVQFERNTSKEAGVTNAWIKTNMRAQHTHDVRALVCTEKEIVSAGAPRVTGATLKK